MGVAVVLPSPVVPVVGTGGSVVGGGTGGQALQPLLDVRVQPRLVVVHEDRGGDVHGRDQHHPLLDAGDNRDDLEDNFGLLRRDYTEKPALAVLRAHAEARRAGR